MSATTGAAPVPVELVRQMREELGFEIVVTAYGLTETCGVVSICRPDDSAERISHTSGRAMDGVEVKLADRDGNGVADGSVGEILVRGFNVMQGYFNDAQGTAEALTDDGWLRTGDVGEMDESGYVRITGRIKEMFIVGGFNCYPAEIENVILTHPDVAEVAVIGQPSEKWGESPFAVVVRKNEALIEADVLAHCDGKLARFKLPKGAAFIDLLPRNPNGKVLKRLLREDFPGPAAV